MINIELTEEEIKSLSDATWIDIDGREYLERSYVCGMVNKFIASLEAKGRIKILEVEKASDDQG